VFDCTERARSPRLAIRLLARANNRSPVRIATELPHTVCALGTPRRIWASSMTSSWYSDARCVISTASAAVMTDGLLPVPSWAVSRVSAGRMRLPPASRR
jgi:hypothetical protein